MGLTIAIRVRIARKACGDDFLVGQGAVTVCINPRGHPHSALGAMLTGRLQVRTRQRRGIVWRVLVGVRVIIIAKRWLAGEHHCQQTTAYDPPAFAFDHPEPPAHQDRPSRGRHPSGNGSELPDMGATGTDACSRQAILRRVGSFIPSMPDVQCVQPGIILLIRWEGRGTRRTMVLRLRTVFRVV